MIAGRYELGKIGSGAVGRERRMGKRWRRKLVLSRKPRVGERKDICLRAVSELCQVTDGQGSSTTKADS
jgi:hypothetical protein